MKDKEESAPLTIADKVVKISKASQVANMISSSLMFAEYAAHASEGTPLEAMCAGLLKAAKEASKDYMSLSCKAIVAATDELVELSKTVTRAKSSIGDIVDIITGNSKNKGAQTARLEDAVELLRDMSRKFKEPKKGSDS